MQAISFDSSNGFEPLWGTLGAWAERTRDIDGWHDRLLAKCVGGPEKLNSHERGQIAHIVSTREGAKRLVRAKEPLDARWLLVFDSAQRYRKGETVHNSPFDPFTVLGLDSDTIPEPPDPSQRDRDRKVPEDALDVMEPNLLDREGLSDKFIGTIRGQIANQRAPLPDRLWYIGVWLRQVAHQPTALWWAANQTALHPKIKALIESSLLHEFSTLPQGSPSRVAIVVRSVDRRAGGPRLEAT